MARKTLIHKHTNLTTTSGGVLSPKLPAVGTLEKGEIAVNYKNGYETLSIENDSGEIVPFASLELIIAYTDTTISNKKYAGSTSDGGTANKAASIPFGTVDSTSIATAFTAMVDGITELRDGISLYLKNTVVTSDAASTAPKCWTLNINNLGAKPVYVTTAEATYSTTHFTKNYKMLFTYDTSLDNGNGGWYICQLFNSNTTYSDMTQAEITAGTGTTGRKITPKMLRDNFYTEDEVDDLLKNKANSNDLATVATSGSYNDLEDTPTIPAAVTESIVSDWGFTKNTGTYSKPSSGIPKTDLADAVQTSLGKANTALQSYTETDPTVPAWAKAANKPSYTAAEVGALPDSTTIPTKVSDLTNDSGFTSNTGTITGITMNGVSKGTSGVVNLGTVLTEHQDISGKQDAITTVNVSVDANTGTPSGSASFSGGTLNLSFSNLKGVKGDTGEAGATGPQGQTGPQGPKGDTGVSGDASDLAIIHSVDQTTTYNDTDVAGADAVQTTDKNLIDDEYALFGILENLYKTKAERNEIPDTEEMELIAATAIIDIKERIVRKASCHQITINSRPTNPTVGEHYYDTTIHKPIWFNGTNWTDALGNNV